MRKVKLVSVFVLLALLLSATSNMVMGQEPVPNEDSLYPESRYEVHLQSSASEALGPRETRAVNLHLAYYKTHGMTKDAEMLQKTLDGNLAEGFQRESDLLSSSGDDHNTCYGLVWSTWISRYWWWFGKNGHYAWSHTQDQQDAVIDEVYLRARAWQGSTLKYDKDDTEAPGASVSLSGNGGLGSGDARSDARYKLNGCETYTTVVYLYY